MRRPRSSGDGLAHVGGKFGAADAGKRPGEDLPVAPDQDRMPDDAPTGDRQRREVLALAVTTGDQHGATLEPTDRGNGCAHIGALGVVDVRDAGARRNRLHPVREARKATQGVERSLS